jgi:hypothetical protein
MTDFYFCNFLRICPVPDQRVKNVLPNSARSAEFPVYFPMQLWPNIYLSMPLLHWNTFTKVFVQQGHKNDFTWFLEIFPNKPIILKNLHIVHKIPHQKCRNMVFAKNVIITLLFSHSEMVLTNRTPWKIKKILRPNVPTEKEKKLVCEQLVFCDQSYLRPIGLRPIVLDPQKYHQQGKISFNWTIEQLFFHTSVKI